MTDKSGGPAFPQPEWKSNSETGMREWPDNGWGCGGMSLRDWFAGQASSSIAQRIAALMADASAQGEPVTWMSESLERMLPDLAGMCYQFADAMLRAREASDE